MCVDRCFLEYAECSVHNLCNVPVFCRDLIHCAASARCSIKTLAGRLLSCRFQVQWLASRSFSRSSIELGCCVDEGDLWGRGKWEVAPFSVSAAGRVVGFVISARPTDDDWCCSVREEAAGAPSSLT